MIKNSIFLTLFLALCAGVKGQEVQAKVTVVSTRVGTSVDKKIFQTLQTQLTNFINNRKWTSDAFQSQEKVECSFLLNIDKVVESNVYTASLTIQAARPVYNSSYQTALINFQDADLAFRYVEYQPVEFNESRVQGSDALASNLTATIAYYVYVMLGLDYDSFASKGGDAFFQRAQNIVNNAPESREITGWKAFDGRRNRYWLTENMMNSRYNIVHDVIYTYYRSGLDQMYENEQNARTQILEAINRLQAMNQENPNTMIVQFFMQGKSQELIKIFKKASPQEKVRAIDILQKLDVANAAKYKEEIK
ncbi:DUF4835 family protein [Segetibacter sp. 3557_3]|uniref:type IX secretion system protein PorD n=1 Tax=Segetibacter sp. 3557_3 TaxID=2547429 RepID=UPI001058D92D|nr:DUF4835 family protein [Segetibacter sp. 3557_3]TDH18309.1 DUF4835 family protein [Segetibacter sp. 3557_3]